MRLLKSPGLVLALAVAVVAVPAAATGALPSGKAAPARIAANSTTYTDSTGENPAAPDISTIVVSNNDAGLIQLRINIPNRPTLTRDMLIFLFVDSDANANTGDPESLGADYVLQLFEGEAALFKWDGTDFTRRPGDPPATSLVFSYQAGATFSISAAELGNTTRFGFAAIAVSGITFDPTTGDPIFDATVSDAAPGGGAGLLPVPGDDRAGDARRPPRDDLACCPARGPSVHDAARSRRARTRVPCSRTVASPASAAPGPRACVPRSRVSSRAPRPAPG